MKTTHLLARVQRQFDIFGFKIKTLEGEGPHEPVRLRTTAIEADVGSGHPFRDPLNDLIVE